MQLGVGNGVLCKQTAPIRAGCLCRKDSLPGWASDPPHSSRQIFKAAHGADAAAVTLAGGGEASRSVLPWSPGEPRTGRPGPTGPFLPPRCWHGLWLPPVLFGPPGHTRGSTVGLCPTVPSAGSHGPRGQPQSRAERAGLPFSSRESSWAAALGRARPGRGGAQLPVRVWGWQGRRLAAFPGLTRSWTSRWAGPTVSQSP